MELNPWYGYSLVLDQDLLGGDGYSLVLAGIIGTMIIRAAPRHDIPDSVTRNSAIKRREGTGVFAGSPGSRDDRARVRAWIRRGSQADALQDRVQKAFSSIDQRLGRFGLG